MISLCEACEARPLTSHTWICPSCGLEHSPGDHDLAFCRWQMQWSQNELTDRSEEAPR
jgi:hypothetical protein